MLFLAWVYIGPVQEGIDSFYSFLPDITIYFTYFNF